MGLVTIVLAVWLQLRESRAWLRRLGWWALAVVIFQGLLGGQRASSSTRCNVPGFDMSLGEMLRIPHGVIAQVYVCILFANAAGLSRPWVEEHARARRAARVRRAGWWCVLLLFVQLTVAATMRHNYAGMAIPNFPQSANDGSWLPESWNYLVVLQFLHRVMAALIGVAILTFAHFLWREKSLAGPVRAMGLVLVALVGRPGLRSGRKTIWTGRSVVMTTGHVVLGALTLATSFSGRLPDPA